MSNSTRPSSSSSSGYDERFVVPLEASRRGAHRARVSPLVAVLPIVSVVGIVIGAIAVVYVFLGGGGSGAGSAAAIATPSTVASVVPGHTDGKEPAASRTTPSPVASGTVDKSITLDVYNSTNVTGLARRAATRLAAADWTTDKIETWTGVVPPRTTVYYGTAEQKASAQAVVKTLGQGVVKLLPSTAGDGMAVVIGEDYPGAGTTWSGSTRSTAAGRSSAQPDAAPTNSVSTPRPPVPSDNRTDPSSAPSDEPPTDQPSPSPSTN